MRPMLTADMENKVLLYSQVESKYLVVRMVKGLPTSNI